MNDEMLAAIQTMAEQCCNSKQRNAIYAVMDMICDFWDHKWLVSTEHENRAFVRRYLHSNFIDCQDGELN